MAYLNEPVKEIYRHRSSGDLHAKILIGNNDIFADIVNAFLFDGEPVIREEDLESLMPVSEYAKNNDVSSLERDVVKKWKPGNAQICIIGAENQMDIDPDMVFRSFSYDGSTYMTQVRNNEKERYPVITLVLYYGKQMWNRATTLYDALHIRDDLKRHVENYRMHLIDLRRLDEESVKRLRSEFGAIVKLMINPDEPDETIEFRHKEVSRDLMRSLGIANVSDRVLFNTEDPVTMKRLLTEEERETMKELGKAEGRAESVTNLMRSLNLSAEEAMNLLMIPAEARAAVMEQMRLYNA